jgi:hypothetical protein
MPSLKQDKQAIDFIIKNPTDPRANQAAQKLGLEQQDVEALQFADQNPEDPRSTQAKNKIFLKVAKARPAIQEQSVSTFDRLAVKNLLDREPKLQEEYLKREGFDTRIVDGQLQAKAKDSPTFGVVDPDRFELFDFADVMSDVLEGVAEAVATSAKVGGALVGGGAPGLVGGALLGGATTAGFELEKQALGKILGVREEFSPAAIAEAGVVGATVPLALAPIGAAFKGAAKGIGKIFKFSGVAPRPKAGQIKEAASLLGVKPTPQQMFEGVAAQQSLVEQSSGLFGRKLRKTIEQNKKQLSEVAEDLVNVSDELTVDIGEQVKKGIVGKIKEKLAPAVDIYSRYEAPFKAIPADLTKVKDVIAQLKKDFPFSDTKGLINTIEEDLKLVKNINDLKKFRTGLGGRLEATAPGNKKTIIKRLYGPATEARSDSLLKQAKTQGDEFFAQAQSDIAQADAIWKQTIAEVDEALLEGAGKGGVVERAGKFLGKKRELELTNLLNVKDPKKIVAFKKQFPEEFEILKSAKIEELVKKSMRSGELDPKKIANQIDKLPAETKRLFFDENAVAKAKALKLFLDDVTTSRQFVGPSGTPSGIERFGQTGIPGVDFLIRQFNSFSRAQTLKFMTDSAVQKDMLSRLGQFLQSGKAAGIGTVLTKQSINREGQ